MRQAHPKSKETTGAALTNSFPFPTPLPPRRSGPTHLLLHLLNFFDAGTPDGFVVALDASQGVGGAGRLSIVLSTGASHLLLLLLLRLLQLGLGVDAVSVVHVVRLHHLETRVEICRQNMSICSPSVTLTLVSGAGSNVG